MMCMANFRAQSSAVLPSAKEHLYWLDWLRFSAALMVVAIHSRGGNWVEWARLTEASQTKLVALFFAMTRAGTEWVLVFFVLSGFLVGGKVIERLSDGSFDLPSYVIDRFTRIWTPLIPALCWSALVAYWVGKPISWFDLGGNLLGLQGALFRNFAANMPLWSLGYEIWFYFLAGCVAVWLMAGTRGRIRAGCALVLGFAVFTKMNEVFLFAWIIGAATYWLCNRPRRPLLAAAGGMLVVTGFLSSQINSATISVNTSTWARYAPSNEVAILLLATGIAFVLPFLTQLKPESKFTESINALGGKLAAFSYTLYLTHYPVLYVWEHYLPGRHETMGAMSVLCYLLRISSCVVFGWFCYLPFERQTARLRKLLRRVWITKRFV
jgi:peptidoglycan/LPS O-acetylase OafA/YrhL